MLTIVQLKVLPCSLSPPFHFALPELLLSLVKTTTEIPESIGTAEVCVEFSRQFAQPFQFNARSMLPSQSNITGVRPGRCCMPGNKHWPECLSQQE